MSDAESLPAPTGDNAPPATTGQGGGGDQLNAAATGDDGANTSNAASMTGLDTFSPQKILEQLKSGDVPFALGIMLVLVILILPVPPWLLDIMLALSITFAVLILMTVLFLKKPLDISSFPTILLIATMVRLSLNLASTRLILTNGHEGTDAAGDVIQAFGGFIMGGNFVIGVIVFAILIIVNFMVITKGSNRIAEVAARFTLDAMPGKQMAIDADLSTGIIDEPEARKRRQELQDESSFFGAMDGASKFVRGDAVAGLLITFINVIGGMIIGVAQNDLSFAEAADIYTRLTVGDGLVSQIPALIVSISAGFLVSKAGVGDDANEAMFKQLSNYPKALVLSSFLAFCFAIVPGLPAMPFLLLSVATGIIAYFRYISIDQEENEAAEAIAAESAAAEQDAAEVPLSDTLAIDDLRLELGYGLLTLINSDNAAYRLTDQIRALRRQIASDMGFIMPSVRILDNMQLIPNEYVVQVKEVEAGRGQVRPDRLLIMDPGGQPIELAGEHTTEPTFGLPAVWVEENLREEASFRGYTVVDPSTVITTHLTEIIKDNMSDMLTYVATQRLLDGMDEETRKLVDELIPAQLTVTALQRVLQRLLAERISIRDLGTILEGVSEATGYSQSIMMITEHVRSRLARQICHNLTDPTGSVPLITLSPEWEQVFAESLVGQGEEKQLAMSPSTLQDLITRMRQVLDELANQGEAPALLTSPMVRPYVRSIVERFRPATPVISQNEIHPQARIRTLAQI